jgi:hypothetical protein
LIFVERNQKRVRRTKEKVFCTYPKTPLLNSELSSRYGEIKNTAICKKSCCFFNFLNCQLYIFSTILISIYISYYKYLEANSVYPKRRLRERRAWKYIFFIRHHSFPEIWVLFCKHENVTTCYTRDNISRSVCEMEIFHIFTWMSVRANDVGIVEGSELCTDNFAVSEWTFGWDWGFFSLWV